MDNLPLVQKLSEDVSYMRGKIDATFAGMEKNSESMNKMLGIHESRLGGLELQQGNITTRVSIISAAIGVVVTVISDVLFKKIL